MTLRPNKPIAMRPGDKNEIAMLNNWADSTAKLDGVTKQNTILNFCGQLVAKSAAELWLGTKHQMLKGTLIFLNEIWWMYVQSVYNPLTLLQYEA